MAFLIGGANTLSAGGFSVANSCRFNSGSSDYLEKGSLGTGSTTKATFSAWFKKANLSSSRDIYSLYLNNDNQVRLRLRDTGEISIYISFENVAVLEKRSTRLLRDMSAWYHVCLITDLTESADEDKYKIYINNERITSWAANTNTSATSYDYLVAGGGSYVMHLGSNGPPDNNFYDGYMAEVVLIDGLALAPTSFGEYDEDSPTIWKPINVSGLTFGTNGFYLDFEDSSNLGNDANGGTDFTVGNLTATDQCVDSPTNNFATLNPLLFGSNYTWSEGNLQITQAASNWDTTYPTIGMTAGKWYMEFKGTVGAYFDIGVTDVVDPTNNISQNSGCVAYKSNSEFARAGSVSGQPSNLSDPAINTYTVNDIMSIALDVDNEAVYFAKNGAWENNGDPTSGASKTGAITLPNSGSTYFFAFAAYKGAAASGTCQVNFGNPPYANSSDAADADGYGAFEYAPPSGYFALNTKNLAEYG